MAIKPISREYRIYLALWRKAFLTNEPVVIKVSNLSTAIAMQQGMYRAIKPFRYGEAQDAELIKAVEKFVLHLIKPEDKDKDKPHFIEFRPRVTLNELEEMWDDLGIDETDLLCGEERQMQESLSNLMERITSKDKEEKPSTKTPFYERD